MSVRGKADERCVPLPFDAPESACLQGARDAACAAALAALAAEFSAFDALLADDGGRRETDA